MDVAENHICVCICTYKRTNLLLRLLAELECQKTDGKFSYSAVVVDNDAKGSAQKVVLGFQQSHSLDVKYFIEPEQNIALARNRAVECATGNLIAIIDDDEYPDNQWLLSLHRTLVEYKSDGVLGPVKPHFEESCPRWICKSGICDRKSHPTGYVLNAADTSTANVLVKREVFADPENRFDPKFGRTGGSDVRFFRSVMRKGYRFVWADDAFVNETVPPERWKASFYIKKALRKGGLNGAWVRTKALPGRSVVVEFAAACVYTMVFPFIALLGKHYCIKYLAKAAYHIAWVSGYFGLVYVRLRDD